MVFGDRFDVFLHDLLRGLSTSEYSTHLPNATQYVTKDIFEDAEIGTKSEKKLLEHDEVFVPSPSAVHATPVLFTATW